MNISRNDIEPNVAQITIHVEKSDYAEKVEKKLKDYRKKANIPGFRPGNVPMGLLQKMFGKAVKAEEINNIVSESLFNYIQENDVPMLGEPLPSENQQEYDFENEENYDFSFDLALAPDFDVEITDKDKLKYYTIAANDEMIDNQINSMAMRYGKYEQEDTVEAKDVVKGELLEMKDGKVNEEGLKIQDAVLTPDYMADEDQKKLFVGAKKGDKIIFNPKKAYDNEAEISSMLKISKDDAKIMESDFQMNIQSITRYHAGEVNQELFDKVYGEGTVKDEAAFREKIKENIEEQLKADSDYKFAVDVENLVKEKYNNIEFPEKAIKRWLMKSKENMTEETVNEDYPKMISDLTWHFAKEKLAKKNDIKTEPQEVEDYARKVARAQFAQYGMVGMEDSIVDNYAKDMMKKEDTIRHFYNRVMEEKVLNAVKSQVNPKEERISMEDFNKMFENQEK